MYSVAKAELKRDLRVEGYLTNSGQTCNMTLHCAVPNTATGVEWYGTSNTVYRGNGETINDSISTAKLSDVHLIDAGGILYTHNLSSANTQANNSAMVGYISYNANAGFRFLF